MNPIERTLCAITEKDDLEDLYSFPEFPVFMGCVSQPETADLTQNMNWWISRGSGLIQLKQLLPLDVLYPESHGSGAVGALWEQHHKAFAQFLRRLSPASILEVGGAHGILAKEYHRFSKIPWTILEPNPAPVDGCDARFIKGFFDDKFAPIDAFDTLVHSHVFEHFYEPIKFMRHLSGLMNAGQHLVFSLPNMQVMLERKYTNCVNFEHTILLTEPHVEFLLAKHGFRLVSKEYFLDDHSIFYAATRDPCAGQIALPSGLYEKNRALYIDYVHYHQELVSNLNCRLSATDQPVYLFGAHVQAQYLMGFGLDMRRICAILDNDRKKHGKRLFGTNKQVYSPSVLDGIEEPIVIIRAGTFTDEIVSQIRAINSTTHFLL